jgi:hypothetical protein
MLLHPHASTSTITATRLVQRDFETVCDVLVRHPRQLLGAAFNSSDQWPVIRVQPYRLRRPAKLRFNEGTLVIESPTFAEWRFAWTPMAPGKPRGGRVRVQVQALRSAESPPTQLSLVVNTSRALHPPLRARTEDLADRVLRRMVSAIESATYVDLS